MTLLKYCTVKVAFLYLMENLPQNFSFGPENLTTEPSVGEKSQPSPKKGRFNLPKLSSFFKSKGKLILIGLFLLVFVGTGLTMRNSPFFRQFGRKIGLVRPSLVGFFEAQHTQDLAYDFNNDGQVTEADYLLLVESLAESDPGDSPVLPPGEVIIPEDDLGAIEEVTASDESPESDVQNLPSVSAFTSDVFNGAASVAYPLALPAGPAGISPGLSLSYSTSVIDDMWTGIGTKYRTYFLGDNDYAFSHQVGAGIFGLGWNLGGMGYIARDTAGSLKDFSDDDFSLVFAGGSANLVPESDCSVPPQPYSFDDISSHRCSVWRTVPNLKTKIIRKGEKKQSEVTVWRYHWEVTTGDGTKYIFGSPQEENWYDGAPADPDTKFDNFKDSAWYRLYNGNGSRSGVGTRAWLVYKIAGDEYHAITYKWLLHKVANVYASPSSVCDLNNPCLSYEHYLVNGEFEINTDGDKRGYTAAIYPQKVNYGAHEVEFVPEEGRLDYSTASGDTMKVPQQRRTSKRISKILVKTSETIVRAYTFDYHYGWRAADHPELIDSNNDGLPESGSETRGQAIHSLLNKITEWAGNPVVVGTQHLPAYEFKYQSPGSDCGDFKGGCPLTSFIDKGATAQRTNANDFFLTEATNGYNGKVSFEYWGGAGDNAFPVRYCDRDKLRRVGFDDESVCLDDHSFNTQRHRVAAKVTDDGMGNTVRTTYDYEGAQGLAYVKTYEEEYNSGVGCRDEDNEDGCNPETTVCDGGSCSECDNWNKDTAQDCGSNWTQEICWDRSAVRCVCKCHKAQRPFAGYEFLGYPSVVARVYKKNSSDLAAQSKTDFYQAMEVGAPTVAGCFKPSPLKGSPKTSITYNVDDGAPWSSSESVYKVRFGDMFNLDPYNPNEEYSALADGSGNLNDFCESYDLEKTPSIVMVTESRSKTGDLCTKSTINSNYSDGSLDPFANPREAVSWGRVSCSDWSDIQDYDNYTARYSFTRYTGDDGEANGWNEGLWLLPRPKESWSSDSSGGSKYQWSKTFYENQAFGNLFDPGTGYSRVTKTEVWKDGQAYAVSRIGYEDGANRPWNVAWAEDPQGRKTTTEYDSVYHQFPVRVVNPINQVVETEYDFQATVTGHPNNGWKLGLPVRVTDPNKVSSMTTYDRFGRPVEAYGPGRTLSDGYSQRSEYYYFNDADLACSTADPGKHCIPDLGKNNTPKMMVQTMAQFDASANPDAGDYGELSVSRAFYNGLGQQVQSRASWRGPGGFETNVGISVEGEGNRDILTSSTYTALGQPERSSLSYTADPFWEILDQPYLTLDWSSSSIPRINRDYDGLGRVSQVLYPGRVFEHFEYTGNPLISRVHDKNCTDPLSETTCTVKETLADAFGQTVQVKEIESDGTDTYTTKYEYHPIFGSLVQTTDTLDNVVNKMAYDSLGRKTKMWDIDMSPALSGDEAAWAYEYDNLGNLIFQIDPENRKNNHKIRLCYDDLNRLTGKDLVALGALSCEDASVERFLAYQYDQGRSGYTNEGQKTTFTSYSQGQPVQEVEYNYNHQGQLAKQEMTLSNMFDSTMNNQTSVSEYTYDLGGRALTVAYPVTSVYDLPAETVTYQYQGPYLYSTSSATDQYVLGAEYNKDGQMTRLNYANGVSDTYTYDPNTGRLESSEVNNAASGWGIDRLSLNYDYDPVGNITSINDTSGKPSDDPFYLGQAFEYDPLYRLTAMTADTYVANYQYDAVGNILVKNEGQTTSLLQAVTLDYSTTAGSTNYHRPHSVAINQEGEERLLDYQYDDVGNLIDDGLRHYNYDAQNRLSFVANNEYRGTMPGSPPQPTPTWSTIPIPPGGFTEFCFGSDTVIGTDDVIGWLASYSSDSSPSDANSDGKINVAESSGL
ncbi:SpvB/TcaC N-terminal domain-containing protein, partial [Patescibacteria group bacterium]